MLRKFLKNRNNSSSVDVNIYNDMLSSVAWELGRRIDEQEKKISNIDVRTELLETITNNNNNNVISNVSSQINSQSQFDSKAKINMNIIKLIEEEGGMISSDVKIKIEKSREHTSRLLKELCDFGYLERDLNSRPYKYLVTELGKNEIKD